MKVEVKSKKGLRTVLSVIVDKKSIQTKMNDRLNELQKEVALKGFRPGKVPPAVIKSQFGKSIYGEVVDKILRETSSKAIDEKKLKIAGQPKIDLKQFGEGKDLNYELQIDCLPKVELKSFEKFKATEYKIKIENKIIEEKLKEIASQNKQFEDKKENEKAVIGDQVVFDYSATVDGNKFDGSEGKGVQIELGKDLFLKGFDEQLVGVKKGDEKTVDATLPANHPKKELANKKTKFVCKISNIKKSKESKIDDNFAKMMGAKDVKDLNSLIEKQISSQYSQALNSITKKEILDQIEKNHQIDLPQNLIDQEISIMTQNLKPEEKEKHKTNNEKFGITLIDKSSIKNYKTDGISSFLRVDHQDTFNIHYYGGYGLYSNGLGAAISIGCDNHRGCGALTSLVYSRNIHDLEVNLITNNQSNEYNLKYTAYLNQRLSLNYSIHKKINWLGLNLKF